MQALEIRRHPMITLTTTPTVEGRHIKQYHGVVMSESVFGTNFSSHALPGLRNAARERSDSHKQELHKARRHALEELQAEARNVGANGVVGIHIQYEIAGDNDSIIMVFASGTAVVLE
jgi:uncharacterized protein YbjQ (UPF0145 family)